LPLNGRTNADLCAIARAGGGMVLNGAVLALADMSAIARAAASGNARITFTGCGNKTMADLAAIGRAGAGAVQFTD